MKNPFAALFGKPKTPADMPVPPVEPTASLIQNEDVVTAAETTVSPQTAQPAEPTTVVSSTASVEPVLQPAATKPEESLNNESIPVVSPIGAGPVESQQLTNQETIQPSASTSGVISDVAPQPTEPVENNSPSQPNLSN